jgi:D-glycero-alpha-D-manno-heptose 1-phosphate guanylyltransferase
MTDLGNIDAVLLAGGKGTRLAQALPDLPKALAPVAGRPWLYHQLDYLALQGIRRVILALGFKADLVVAAMQDYDRPGLAVSWSIEPEPMDTGGGLAYALPLIQSDPVMVLNADSMTAADLKGFAAFHEASHAAASLIAIEMEDAARYGRLDLDPSGRVRGFREKEQSGAGVMNAGIYLLRRSLIEALPKNCPVSLEREIFPSLCGQDFFAYRGRFPFLDIGTPQSYATAGAFLAALGKA